MQYRTIHGHRRAFRAGGHGPALLFVHGIGDCSETWRDLLPVFARDFTVVAPDLLGHGRSARPRADYAVAAYACGMRDLLTVLGIDRVTVIGHSLGGGVAAQFAYQFPEMTQRLVLVACGGVGREVHPLLRLAASPGAEAFLPLATCAPVRSAVRRLTGTLTALDILGLADDLRYVLERYDRLRDHSARCAFLRTLRSVVDYRGQVVTVLDRCYLAAGVPTMLIWGARDNVIPASHARHAHEQMPGSRLGIFAQAGHFPHHSDPCRFVAAVTDFLAETPDAQFNPRQWQEILRGGGRDWVEQPPHGTLDLLSAGPRALMPTSSGS